mgnify:CR=1 FL=1
MSVPEVTSAGKHHRDAVLVGRGDQVMGVELKVRDLDRAIDLLKALPSDEDREKARRIGLGQKLRFH